MLFGTIGEHCESSREMTAGQHKYGAGRRPVELRAAEYIVHSLDWIQSNSTTRMCFHPCRWTKSSLEISELFAKHTHIVLHIVYSESSPMFITTI
jgi:hypothetical protein